MQVTLEVPEEIAHLFGENSASLTRAVLEALVLEGLRSDKLSAAQARRFLGISSRHEMDGFLKKHGVYLPLTVVDVMHDAETSRAFRLR
jgi:hypothetical protein